MKKTFLILSATLPLLAPAQNLQLHFDLGKPQGGSPRNFLVGTVEHYQPDTLGYTFLFADIEFASADKPAGASLAYFEVARTLYMPWFRNVKPLKNLMLHVEYNDGLVIYPDAVNDSLVLGENLRSSWLAGPEYGWAIGDFSLNAMLLYKYTRGSAAPDAQVTLIWFYPLFRNRISLCGYIDIWSQSDFYDNPENKLVVFYAEPQAWYNITSHLSVGTELKISKNFVYGSQRVEVFPTIGLKWLFR